MWVFKKLKDDIEPPSSQFELKNNKLSQSWPHEIASWMLGAAT